MKTEPERTQRIIEIIDSFPPFKSRVPQFKRPDGVRGDASIDWLLNDWMPSQKDFPVIAELTCLLHFNVAAVLAALMGRDRFERFIKENYL